jgi:ParB family chromosome partitioning protein
MALSDRVGKKRSTVTNYLRLLKLPAEIQLGIRERKLTMGHARALVNLDDSKLQIDIFQKIIENDLSVRKVEELVRKSQQSTQKKSSPPVEEKEKQYEDLKTHLSNQFGSDIDFKRNNKGVGKIVIPFKSDEDLERIIAILDKLNA